MKNEISEILQSKDLQDITIDLVEKVLDNEITNDILKEVPILKSLIAVKNVYTSYTDKLFIKKTMNVLLELGEINSEERYELTNELDDEDESGIEKILMAIDKLETIKKCKVFGRLCKLKATGEISVSNFLRLTKLIQDAYLDDLVLVTYFKLNEKKEIWEGEFFSLISLGLIFQEPSEQTPIERNNQYDQDDPEFKGGEIKFYYLLSDLGEILLRVYKDLLPKDKK
jgi:hypothetical protein